MHSQLERIFYVSRASPSLQPHQIRGLVSAAQIHNRQRDLTGVLSFSGRYFGGVLEGRTAPIEQMLEQLKLDSRHTSLRLVSRHVTTKRLFADFSLGYVLSGAFDDRLRFLLEAPSEDDDAAQDFVLQLVGESKL